MLDAFWSEMELTETEWVKWTKMAKMIELTGMGLRRISGKVGVSKKSWSGKKNESWNRREIEGSSEAAQESALPDDRPARARGIAWAWPTPRNAKCVRG
jgi:hypothetical protein